MSWLSDHVVPASRLLLASEYRLGSGALNGRCRFEEREKFSTSINYLFWKNHTLRAPQGTIFKALFSMLADIWGLIRIRRVHWR